MRDEKSLQLLGRRIARLRREKKDWSQDQLAEHSRMSRSFLAEIETGKRNIAFLNLLKIAQILGITVSNLVNIDEQLPVSNSTDVENP